MDYYFFRTVIFENLRRMKNIDRNHPKIEVLLFTERTQYTILNIVVGQLVELVPYGGLMFVTFVYGIHNIILRDAFDNKDAGMRIRFSSM